MTGFCHFEFLTMKNVNFGKNDTKQLGAVHLCTCALMLFRLYNFQYQLTNYYILMVKNYNSTFHVVIYFLTITSTVNLIDKTIESTPGPRIIQFWVWEK